MGRLAFDLEQAFRGPRDIEFAVTTNPSTDVATIHLLQSRPITTLHTWSDHQLLHEFDSAVASDTDDYFTTANIG